jgi:hypothetical protein
MTKEKPLRDIPAAAFSFSGFIALKYKGNA